MIKNKNADGTGGSRDENANTTKLTIKSITLLASQCLPVLLSHKVIGSITISI
jgi:hypothetical protein